jgi:NACHT domain- and WD repeat-containing protein
MAGRELTFWVPVSSTFSDLKAERDALQRDVFPRLRELCQKHGCRFQAIDLRWGVSEEAVRYV